MKHSIRIFAISLTLSALPMLATAADLDEMTMQVTDSVDKNEVMEMISLPGTASDRGRERSAAGLARANEARGATGEVLDEVDSTEVEEQVADSVEVVEDVVEQQETMIEDPAIDDKNRDYLDGTFGDPAGGATQPGLI